METVALLDLILQQNRVSDEAMWYLLHSRMDMVLRGKFREYENRLWDSYEDLIDDFFLYLRQEDKTVNQIPYAILRTLQNKGAFEGWLLSTWRNFLSNRVRNEEISQISYQDDNHPSESDLTEKPVPDERKIEIISQLISYCDQVFLPRGRFIFLRSMLTILNKDQALPAKEMAQALGMTEVSYRVASHRLKTSMDLFMNRILQGESLRLDAQHQMLAERINNGFDNLYSVLILRYDDALQTLKQRDAIMSLRLSYIKDDGMMLHEDCQKYRMTVSAFWNKLNR